MGVDDLNNFKKHRNGISESLTTTLVGRDKEVSELCNEIRQCDLLVITGPSGVGKSRLAVAAIEHYCLSAAGTIVLCTKSFSDYIADLEASINEQNQYVIFVDDANKYSKLTELVDFLKYKNAENIKVVFTVRDYLKECFNEGDHLAIRFYEVKPLENKSVKEAISANTPIQNEKWLDQIAEIAKGNIRVAFLAADGALKDRNGFSSLFDQKDVLNRFYKNEISKIEKSDDLTATAGLIAFFRCVYLDQLFYIAPVLQKLGMSKQRFIENANLLVNAEIADDYKGVIRISDQCFADYMLNYTLIEKRLAKISDLLAIGFKYYRKQIVESAKTILHVYFSADTLSYIRDQVIAACDALSGDLETKHEIEAAFAQVAPAYVASDFNDGVENYAEIKDAQWLLRIFANLALTDYSQIAMKGAIKLLEKAKSKSEEVLKAISGAYTLDEWHVNAKFRYVMDFIACVRERKASRERFVGLVSSYLKFRIDFSEWSGRNELKYGSIVINDEIPNILPFRTACWDFLFDVDCTGAIDAVIDFAKHSQVKGCEEIIKNDMAAIGRHLGESEKEQMVKAVLITKFGREANELGFENEQKYLGFFHILLEAGMPNGNYDEAEKKYSEAVSAYFQANENSLLVLLQGCKVFLDLYFLNEERKFLSALVPNIKESCPDWFSFFSSTSINPGYVVDRFADLCGKAKLYTLINEIEKKDVRDQYSYFFYENLSKTDCPDTFGFANWVKSKVDKSTTTSWTRSVLNLRKISEKSGISYIELVEILFRKRKYNSKIAANYLSPFFFKNGAFKELLELNQNLAAEVYGFLIDSGETDYGSQRLKELLSAKPNYIKTVAKNFVEGKVDYESAENFILSESCCSAFMDACMKTCLDKQSDYFHSVKLQILMADNIDKETLSNWISSYIERGYKDDKKMLTLFSYLGQVGNPYKNQIIIEYYQKGKCKEVLERALKSKVCWYDDSKKHYASEINGLESLKRAFLHRGSIAQAEFIDERIENAKRNAKAEEIERLMDYPDQRLLRELKEQDSKTEVSLKDAFELYKNDESFRKMISSGFVSYSDGSFATKDGKPLKFEDAFKERRIIGIAVTPFNDDENLEYESYLSKMKIIQSEFQNGSPPSLDECLTKLFKERGWDYSQFNAETLLSRDLFSKIKNGQRPHMAKKTMVQLLIGLKLPGPERNYLLALNGTALSKYVEEDVLYAFLLESKVEAQVANELLRALGKEVFNKESKMKFIL